MKHDDNLNEAPTEQRRVDAVLDSDADLFGGGWEADFNHTVWKSGPHGTVNSALGETRRPKGDA